MGRDRTHHIYAAFFVLYYFRSLDGRSYLLVVADSKNVVSVLSGPSLVPGSARCLQMSLLLSISMILSDIEMGTCRMGLHAAQGVLLIDLNLSMSMN